MTFFVAENKIVCFSYDANDFGASDPSADVLCFMNIHDTLRKRVSCKVSPAAYPPSRRIHLRCVLDEPSIRFAACIFQASNVLRFFVSFTLIAPRRKLRASV